ncbi:zinc finger HIT domain-containing protein 2-like [Ciona intestinalis]
MDAEVCGLCHVSRAKYTCPRCNIRYCMLDCYKGDKHSDCSELFYRECFIGEMKDRHVSDEEKMRLLKMIERTEEENPIEDFTLEEDLEERLKDLNVEDLGEDEMDELWSRLTLQEQEDFKAAVASGSLRDEKGHHVVQSWEPWWLKHDSGLVKELDVSSKSTKPCSKDLAKSPSPLVAFNLVNVLFPYVVFQRIFNGCGVSEFSEEFSKYCTTTSEYLLKNVSFHSAEKAISGATEKCVEAANAYQIQVEKVFFVECIQDVSHLLIGPDPENKEQYAIQAISDLKRGCQKCRKLLKTEIDSLGSSGACQPLKENRKLLFQIVKKIEYLISYCSKHNEIFSFLSIEVSEIYKKRLDEEKVQTELETSVENLRKKPVVKKPTKNLIVELD